MTKPRTIAEIHEHIVKVDREITKFMEEYQEWYNQPERVASNLKREELLDRIDELNRQIAEAKEQQAKVLEELKEE